MLTLSRTILPRRARFLILTAATMVSLPRVSVAADANPRPNILLVITDDQGYGDLGFHGNPVIRTPNLDALARSGVRMTRFLVSPVCSPTRASLMTGRYNYRTGVVDTYIGRSMMRSGETTLAEMLRDAGWATGIFGKWHLGDNFPMRPQDQGFDRSLVHNGGGIGQPADPPGNMYDNPLLREDGVEKRFEGYCSDIFTDGAIGFIREKRDRPFFAYLSFNAPHTPLQSPGSLYEQYKRMNMTADMFPDKGHPLDGKFDADVTAHIYAMVTNIDDNMGRLLDALRETGQERDTIVIFLTDNGPQQPRYNGGLRGRKGSVYEGGIRVPMFIRWPARLAADTEMDTMAAHIDITPTLLDLCGVKTGDTGRPMDGTSLAPVLLASGSPGAPAAAEPPDRTLYFQWHRGDEPQLYRAFAARTDRWKLVQAAGVHEKVWNAEPVFELFDLKADPWEMNNLASGHPEVVSRMKRDYESWFRDVSSGEGYAPVRPTVGSSRDNPSTLTRQDWRGPRAGWGPKDLGHWEIHVGRTGLYNIRLRFAEVPTESRARLRFGENVLEAVVETGTSEVAFRDVMLNAGPETISGEIQVNDNAEPVGVHYIDIEYAP